MKLWLREAHTKKIEEQRCNIFVTVHGISDPRTVSCAQSQGLNFRKDNANFKKELEE